MPLFAHHESAETPADSPINTRNEKSLFGHHEQTAEKPADSPIKTRNKMSLFGHREQPAEKPAESAIHTRKKKSLFGHRENELGFRNKKSVFAERGWQPKEQLKQQEVAKANLLQKYLGGGSKFGALTAFKAAAGKRQKEYAEAAQAAFDAQQKMSVMQGEEKRLHDRAIRNEKGRNKEQANKAAAQAEIERIRALSAKLAQQKDIELDNSQNNAEADDEYTTWSKKPIKGKAKKERETKMKAIQIQRKKRLEGRPTSSEAKSSGKIDYYSCKYMRRTGLEREEILDSTETGGFSIRPGFWDEHRHADGASWNYPRPKKWLKASDMLAGGSCPLREPPPFSAEQERKAKEKHRRLKAKEKRQHEKEARRMLREAAMKEREDKRQARHLKKQESAGMDKLPNLLPGKPTESNPMNPKKAKSKVAIASAGGPEIRGLGRPESRESRSGISRPSTRGFGGSAGRPGSRGFGRPPSRGPQQGRLPRA
jgi:hypothetical protein